MKTTLRQHVIKLFVMTNSAILSLGIAGCAPEAVERDSDASRVQPSYKTGTPVDLNFPGGNTAKVTIKGARYTTRSLGSKAMPSSPKKGRFLILDVLWESGKERTYASFARLSAVDGFGRKAGRVIWVDNEFPSGEVLPGERVRGIVAFDVSVTGPVHVAFHDAYAKEVARITMPPLL